MKRTLILGLCLTLLPLAGCSTLKELAKAMTLSQCQFRMVSVADTSVAGISIQGKKDLGDINLMNMLKLQRAFSSGQLPLEFTLNLEGKNPNDSDAGLGHFAWILDVDGSELTRG